MSAVPGAAAARDGAEQACAVMHGFDGPHVRQGPAVEMLHIVISTAGLKYFLMATLLLA